MAFECLRDGTLRGRRHRGGGKGDRKAQWTRANAKRRVKRMEAAAAASLLRCSRFMYEVVCAFIIQDLDGLLSRFMRKAAADENNQQGFQALKKAWSFKR